MQNKKSFLLLLGASLFALTGCGGSDLFSPNYSPSDSGYYRDTRVKEDGTNSYIVKEEDDKPGVGIETNTSILIPDEFISKYRSGRIPAGQLTAKALFDNRDYNYTALAEILNNEDTTGDYHYFVESQKKFNLDYKRVKVTVNNAPYAHVSLWDENDVSLWDAVADANGEAYLFSNKPGSKVVVSLGDVYRTYEVEDNMVIDDFSNGTLYDTVQILINLDTTGSMGDELEYLKAELADVVANVKESTNANVEVGVLCYRDTKDEYLTKKFDFTTDIDAVLAYLKEQKAKGGGDLPEAVQTAFAVASEFSWKDDSTKVILHVADAASHDEDVKEWFGYVKSLTALGAHILTVASSGIDKKIEYLFRLQSMQSNGCYAFLTDDSGIGNSHVEASTNDELTVEYLNDLLIRVINGFHTGTFAEPVAYNEKYTELISYNATISLSKFVQAVLAHYYVKQYGAGQVEPKARVEYYYELENGPYALYMKDNFTYVRAEEVHETIDGLEFIYPTDLRTIMIFKLDTFYTLKEAFEQQIISKSELASIYEQAYMFRASVDVD